MTQRNPLLFSSIDRQGRYAYSNQSAIGLWNLTRLAEALLPLFDEDPQAAVNAAREVLEGYSPRYEAEWLAGMREKCGLTAGHHEEGEDDKNLIDNLLAAMADNSADFTLTFFHLSRLHGQVSERDNDLRDLFDQPGQIGAWLGQWRQRLSRETRNDAERQAAMQAVNPVYIPRSHQIEAAIRSAEDAGDFSAFHALHSVLQNPYVRQAGMDRYMQAPEPDEVVEYTFCGT